MPTKIEQAKQLLAQVSNSNYCVLKQRKIVQKSPKTEKLITACRVNQ